MSPKINTPQDLEALKRKAVADIDLRSGPKDLRLTVHMGTCGIAAGARDILMALIGELREANVGNVSVQQSGCAGLCDQEPMITLTDKGGGVYRYGKLDRPKVHVIVREHIVRGQAVEELLLKQ